MGIGARCGVRAWGNCTELFQGTVFLVQTFKKMGAPQFSSAKAPILFQLPSPQLEENAPSPSWRGVNQSLYPRLDHGGPGPENEMQPLTINPSTASGKPRRVDMWAGAGTTNVLGDSFRSFSRGSHDSTCRQMQKIRQQLGFRIKVRHGMQLSELVMTDGGLQS